MKSSWISALLIVIALACNKQAETQYVMKIKVEPFDSTKIFDAEYVADYNFDLKECNVDSLQQLSKKHFLKAIDLYRNQKKPWDAIEHFRTSIYLYPEPKTYFELANAMLDTKDAGQIELSHSVIYLLERLDYTPISNLHYLRNVYQYYDYLHIRPDLELSKKDMEEKLSNRKTWVINDLVYGMKKGYFDLTKIEKDTRIDGVTKDPYFKQKYSELLAENAKDGTKLNYSPFQEFVNLFPKNEGVFSTTLANPGLSKHNVSIPYSFSNYIDEMENTSFGREVSNDFFYVTNLKQTEKYTALLYKSVGFWGSEGAASQTMLVTYNPEGKQISKVMFACECSYSKIKTATFDDKTIAIKDYKRIWKKSLKDVSIDDNKLLKNELTNSYELEINDSGVIVEKNSNKTFTDSTLKASL